MPDPEPIFLYGAGGHALSVAEVIRRQGHYRIGAVLDDQGAGSRTFGGLVVEGGREHLAHVAEHGPRTGIVAIGDNRDRELICELAIAAGLGFVTVIDPTAIIAADVRLGAGSVVMPGAIVNVATRVGDHAILNTGCSVDHECEVGDFAHLSPGVRVSGACRIGRRAHLGIGSCVMQAVTVGAGAQVGAGAAVVSDVEDGMVVVGVPARPIGVRGL